VLVAVIGGYRERWMDECDGHAAPRQTDIDHVSVHTLHQHDAPGYDPSAERILQPRARAKPTILLHGQGDRASRPPCETPIQNRKQ